MTFNGSVLNKLRAHPTSKRMSSDGILSFPEDDPNPELTLTMYALWTSVREFVTLSEQGQPGLAACFLPQTPLQILSRIESAIRPGKSLHS
jgi:hypothetical protein